MRVLTQVKGKRTINHLQVFPMVGRNSTPHDTVRDLLLHAHGCSEWSHRRCCGEKEPTYSQLQTEMPSLRCGCGRWDMRLSIACAATDAEYQHPQPSVVAQAALSRSQPCATRGGAPHSRSSKDQASRLIVGDRAPADAGLILRKTAFFIEPHMNYILLFRFNKRPPRYTHPEPYAFVSPQQEAAC